MVDSTYPSSRKARDDRHLADTDLERTPARAYANAAHHEAARLTGRDYIPLERRRETVEFGRCRQCGHAPRRRAGWLMDAGVRTIRAGGKDVFV
jgi:hypothetical protein